MKHYIAAFFILISFYTSTHASDTPHVYPEMQEAIYNNQLYRSLVYINKSTRESITALGYLLPDHSWSTVYKEVCLDIQEEANVMLYKNIAAVIDECLEVCQHVPDDRLTVIKTTLEAYKNILDSGKAHISSWNNTNNMDDLVTRNFDGFREIVQLFTRSLTVYGTEILTGLLQINGVLEVDGKIILNGINIQNPGDISGLTNHALLVGNASGSASSLPVATNGQIPIGSTGADPVIAAITAGAGIMVTNGAGSITIAATGGGGGVNSVTGGDNITITGPATDPIVNLANPVTALTINPGPLSLTGNFNHTGDTIQIGGLDLTGNAFFTSTSFDVTNDGTGANINLGTIAGTDISIGSPASPAGTDITILQSNSNISLNAGNNIGLAAANSLAFSATSNDITFAAGNNVNFNTGVNFAINFSGLVSIAGNNLNLNGNTSATLQSGGDVDVTSAGADINITADNNILLSAALGGLITLRQLQGNIAMSSLTDTTGLSTISLDCRSGTVTFTGFTTAAGASQVFTINNTFVTAGSSVLITINNGGTNDAQMTITRTQLSASSMAITVRNNGAAALNGNVNITFWVLQ